MIAGVSQIVSQIHPHTNFRPLPTTIPTPSGYHIRRIPSWYHATVGGYHHGTVLTAEVVWLSGAVGWVSSCNKQYTLTLFARAPQASQHVGAEHPGRDPAHISTAHQPTMAAEKIPGEFHRPSDAVEFYEHHMSDLSSLMKGEMAIYLNENTFYDADGAEVTNAIMVPC